jgi:alpha/beta superfamily hydrolase
VRVLCRGLPAAAHNREVLGKMAERAVRFPSDRKSGSITLDGLLRFPTHATEAPGAVLCHPHPAGGGEMGVPLLAVIAEGLGAVGYATIRFDFGGVGRSTGVFSDGVEETADVKASFDYLASLPEADGENISLVGWSFGAWMCLKVLAEGLTARSMTAVAQPLVAYPWEGYAGAIAASTAERHYIVGDGDPFCPLATLEKFTEAISGEDARRIHILSGADHFLFGREQEVAGLICGILKA